MSGMWQEPVARVLASTESGDTAAVVGTGTLVSTPQYGVCLLTAAHVVNGALENRLEYTAERPGSEELLRFDLPMKGTGAGRTYVARIIEWFPPRPREKRVENPVSDIALLQVVSAEGVAGGPPFPGAPRAFRPENFRVVDDGDLARRIRLVSFGFRRPGGAFAEGHVAGIDAPGWLHLVGIQNHGDFIAKGFSGAPVLDESRQRILGMAVAVADGDSRLAFLQSARNIWRACPALARPYRGLRAFEEEDAPFFFGRDAFVNRMLEKAAVHPILGVTASSGSGKSSAIRAGLLPKIRAGELRDARIGSGMRALVLILRPENDPWKQLAKELVRLAEPGLDILTADDEADKRACLLREAPRKLVDYAAVLLREKGADRLVIFVDQFEELFTLSGHERGEDSAEGPRALGKSESSNHEIGGPNAGSANSTGKKQPDFRDLMVATAGLRVSPCIQWLYALRGDFADRGFKHRAFADAVGDGNLMLADMTAEELQEAICRPAKVLDVEFEGGMAVHPGLASRIAQDAGATGGALPLMQHVLEQLWLGMRDRRLTHAAYDELGGLRGALNRHAGRVFADLPVDKQLLVPRLFSRLLNVEESGAVTRRVARRKELGDALWEVATALANEDSRLLTLRGVQAGQSGQSSVGSYVDNTVEVGHEALLRHWDRLKGWVRDDLRFLLWRRRLEQQHTDHEAAADKAGTWLSGSPLQTAIGWLQARPDDLSERERRFIEQSKARQDEAEERERQHQRELQEKQAQAALAEERRKEAELRTAKEREAAAQKITRRTVLGTMGAVAMGGVAGFTIYRADKQQRDLNEQLASDLKSFWRQRGEDTNLRAVPDGTEETRSAEGGTNSGDGSGVPTWAIKAVGADQSRYTGRGSVIALVGTGVEASHPAFRGVTLIQKDFTATGNGDLLGHDTHNGGTIFGRPVNNMRFGVAPGVTEVLVAKVLGERGTGSKEALLAGLQWIIDHPRKVDVVCVAMALQYAREMSSRLAAATHAALGAEAINQALDAEVAKGLRDYWELLRIYQSFSAVAASVGKGAVLVMAAGNDSTEKARIPVTSPISLPQGVISVGAVQEGPNGYRVPYFSNSLPVLAAPGSGLLSADVNGMFAEKSGTSMACACATGVAALWWEYLRSKRPAEEVTSRMVASEMLGAVRRDVFAPEVQEFERGAGLIQAPPNQE
jgi:hypothetical protein